MSQEVEFMTTDAGRIVVDLTPELGKRLMEMLGGATAGWLLIGKDPDLEALQVDKIVTWKIKGGIPREQ